MGLDAPAIDQEEWVAFGYGHVGPDPPAVEQSSSCQVRCNTTAIDKGRCVGFGHRHVGPEPLAVKQSCKVLLEVQNYCESIGSFEAACLQRHSAFDIRSHDDE